MLGHEVGHVAARHVSQQYTRSAGTARWPCCWSVSSCPSVQPFGDLASAGLGTLFLKFGRDDELESDRLGVEYAVKAGWDPAACRASSRRCRASTRSARAGIPNWLSTHPDPGSRVVKAQPIAERPAEGQAERNRDEYLRRVDGLAYGDDPA